MIDGAKYMYMQLMLELIPHINILKHPISFHDYELEIYPFSAQHLSVSGLQNSTNDVLLM